MNVGAKALVEELKDLVRVIDLILTNEPLVLFLVELLGLISLILLERNCQVRNCLEAVVSEEAMSLLGILKDAKEDWALYLVLILAEGIDNCCELVVYLSKS